MSDPHAKICAIATSDSGPDMVVKPREPKASVKLVGTPGVGQDSDYCVSKFDTAPNGEPVVGSLVRINCSQLGTMIRLVPGNFVITYSGSIYEITLAQDEQREIKLRQIDFSQTLAADVDSYFIIPDWNFKSERLRYSRIIVASNFFKICAQCSVVTKGDPKISPLNRFMANVIWDISLSSIPESYWFFGKTELMTGDGPYPKKSFHLFTTINNFKTGIYSSGWNQRPDFLKNTDHASLLPGHYQVIWNFKNGQRSLEPMEEVK